MLRVTFLLQKGVEGRKVYRLYTHIWRGICEFWGTPCIALIRGLLVKVIGGCYNSMRLGSDFLSGL